jgi:hypothetical protein
LAFYINLPLGAMALAVVWFTMHLRGRLVRMKLDWLDAAPIAVVITASASASIAASLRARSTLVDRRRLMAVAA